MPSLVMTYGSKYTFAVVLFCGLGDPPPVEPELFVARTISAWAKPSGFRFDSQASPTPPAP